jgi:hypothetical protein
MLHIIDPGSPEFKSAPRTARVIYLSLRGESPILFACFGSNRFCIRK